METGFGLAKTALPIVGRGRLNRWGGLLGLLLLLIVVLAGGGLCYFSRPHRLTRLAQDFLERVTGAEVAVVTAQFQFPGVIQLHGVQLHLPGRTGQEAKLFEALQVTVEPHLWAIAVGRIKPKIVRLKGPVLYLTEDLDAGRFTLHELRGEGVRSKGQLPGSLPGVSIEHAQLRFGEFDASGYRALRSLVINGTLTEDSSRAGGYSVVLEQADSSGERTRKVVGTLDLRTMKSTAVVEHFSLGQNNFLPRRLRHWWDRCQPKGSFPTIRVSYDPNPEVGLQAKIVIERGALSLPLLDEITDGKLAISTPRLTEVAGQFAVENETIRVENLTGLIDGIHYQINGVIKGFEPDAPFELSVQTGKFEVGQTPRYLASLPWAAKSYYDRFNPSGKFKISVQVARKIAGGPRHYTGRVDVLGACGVYHLFPYPIEDVYGHISFDNEHVEVVSLTGTGPSGGRIVVRGDIQSPGREAAVQMNIVGDDILIDQHLTRAMQPGHREALELFLSRVSHERLESKGLVRSSDGSIRAANRLSEFGGVLPEFNLGGRCSMVVEVVRPPGPDQKHRVQSTLQVAGLGMVYSHWPYPLKATRGKIIFTPDQVLIEDVHLRSPSGGEGVLHGRIVQDDEGRTKPEIELLEVKLPIDDLLVASISSPQDSWVSQLHLDGTIMGSGGIFQLDDGQIDFQLEGRLQQARSNPNGGGFEFEGLSGAISVSRWQMRLKDLYGRCGQGYIDIQGEAHWSGKDLSTDLQIIATDLVVAPPVLDLLPPSHPTKARLKELWSQYQPEGRMDLRLTYQSDSGEFGDASQEDYTLVIEPKEIAIDVRGRRIHFEPISGVATVHPDGIELKDVSAQFEHGTLELTKGSLAFGPDRPVDFEFVAAADRVDDTTRAILPEGLERLVDAMKLDGAYQISTGKLSRRFDETGASIWSFAGSMRLERAQVDLGVLVTELDASLDMTTTKRSDHSWPRVDIKTSADRLRASGRLIESIDLHLATSEQPDYLQLDQFIGSIYGGAVVGRGQIYLGEPSSYAFELTLDGVGLKPFLDPLEQVSTEFEPPPHASESGQLSANLTIEASCGAPESRRGRGAVEVSNARFYDEPLVHAILQAASMALPTHRAFDRASSRYVVDGDLIRFDSIRLESHSLAIEGTGMMDYPTRKLDLDLVTRNPRVDLGAISEMLNVVKDELVAISVSGTLSKPKARAVSFGGVRRSWQKVFGDGSDGQSALGKPSDRGQQTISAETDPDDRTAEVTQAE